MQKFEVISFWDQAFHSFSLVSKFPHVHPYDIPFSSCILFVTFYSLFFFLLLTQAKSPCWLMRHENIRISCFLYHVTWQKECEWYRFELSFFRLEQGLFSGGSLNPVRILGPALLSNNWHHHWVSWTESLILFALIKWVDACISCIPLLCAIQPEDTSSDYEVWVTPFNNNRLEDVMEVWMHHMKGESNGIMIEILRITYSAQVTSVLCGN